MLCRQERSKCILLVFFFFLTSSGKITNGINMSNSLSVHLLLAQAIPGDSGTAAFFSPLHFVFRTDTWEVEDWNSKTSKLPLCVGNIFHWRQNVTSTFIIGLDNKPPSRGLLFSGSSLYPLWQATVQQLGKIWLFYRYISFCLKAFVQMIILRDILVS